MTLGDEFSQISTIFIDTAPVIYYIEAHPQFGPLAKEVVDSFQSERLNAFSSVITLTEVLPKPIEAGDEKLARKFAEFLKRGKNLSLIEISAGIAERAGRLRGQYSNLRTIDAIQISAAIDVGAGAFLTNDKNLKQIKEIKVLVLKDYL
ncbi:MAG TPA: type II toxin-antitoxin system VapC family toxin [Candidatus Brocadiia bacterium]|nr:PIN domain-containing protein [Planctomycetota bacterium]MDO8092116.1 PIN domain-containing protein [Candidatus Brocadiales bacterium]